MRLFCTANTVTGEIFVRLNVGADGIVLGIQRERRRIKLKKSDDVSVSVCCDREPGILLPLSSRAVVRNVIRKLCMSLDKKGRPYAVEPF